MPPAVPAAQEVPPKHYGGPIGFTESGALRIVVASAAIRNDGPAAVCRAVATAVFPALAGRRWWGCRSAHSFESPSIDCERPDAASLRIR
jgi:hypothetical protein